MGTKKRDSRSGLYARLETRVYSLDIRISEFVWAWDKGKITATSGNQLLMFRLLVNHFTDWTTQDRRICSRYAF
jgi:hypothetical protein